ncbi:MAG TPA: exosortase system-associated protein, TIGR04073 family [Methyloprofundus sp.]|uniref:exosortase system-associated protein, TIGR04073 family n=1 Tax=Methyloprofundus sp. TaxID=2020875 RepID=UPI0018460770|nr:exosortase system-associated protein, TIGR04073 family [Methyloprofundus sp.]HIG64929.1 exosortase system-associated protein, TIGR04073 family [Methyloprofundus sp.]HIL78540.1 exosortase system-associated protein, TIGR04073 family [Methylococcales bacterium]
MRFNKTIVFALLTSIFLSFSSTSHANEVDATAVTEDPYGPKVGEKALRSLANITLGVIEIPKNIIIVSNRTNLLYGLTGGTGLGILNTTGRISVGVLDLLTFPLATKSITQPVYPWDKYLDVYTSYGDMFVLDFKTGDVSEYGLVME